MSGKGKYNSLIKRYLGKEYCEIAKELENTSIISGKNNIRCGFRELCERKEKGRYKFC